MVISRTPYRISFFGGGTDYPSWYKLHGGAVLATSIDKYCYITCRYLPPFFEHRFRVVYSKIEDCMTIDQIKHPAVRAALSQLNFERGVEVHHDGDLPARSGMGSSSSFTVGLLHALYALQGEVRSKKELAEESIQIEQQVLNETVGSQDQVTAAYGGFNHIVFLSNGEISVKPMTLSQTRLDELNDHLMLFYTGIKRTASDVAETYVETIDEKRRQLRILRDMVDEAVSILGSNQNIHHFGELLHEAWQVKRSLSDKVSSGEIDNVYATARERGAIGGKLLGAGGGGFMLLFVPPNQHDLVRAALSEFIHVPFRFEHGGSQIIFYDRQSEYVEQERERNEKQIRAFREMKHA
jgi:D-glycero-alpha-D-manno-heptose-7-phosphate kinase